ncbi:MAG: hypothetical protein M3546_09550 [Actinomycetota bacterium]|nr:hypothetical protein [Actinomycetota bacterium]
MKRERPFRGIRRPPASDHSQGSSGLGGRTPLQVWTAALFNLLADAREELDDTSYVAFASIVVERVEIEAARLAVGEAVRAKRAA